MEEEPGKGVVEGPEVGDEVMKEWELKSGGGDMSLR